MPRRRHPKLPQVAVHLGIVHQADAGHRHARGEDQRVQAHGQTQLGLPQHRHELLGDAGGVQQPGGLLHSLAHRLGSGPVPVRLHQQEEHLQPMGPAQVVAHPGQGLGKPLHPRPGPHRYHRESPVRGQPGLGHQLPAPLGRSRDQVEHRVGGDVQVLPLHPHGPQLLLGAAIPQGDQGRPLHRPLDPAAVARPAQRADAVGVEHHRPAQQSGCAHDSQVVHQGTGGGPVLKQAAPPGQQHIAAAQGLEHPPGSEPGLRLHLAHPLGETRGVGQHCDVHLVAGRGDALADGLQDGVVPGVGEAVVAAHHHPVTALAHLLVHLQAVLGHPMHRVLLQNHLAAV